MKKKDKYIISYYVKENKSLKIKCLSEMGFEPTPTYVDQNTRKWRLLHLESGALDHSAILTTYLNDKIPLPCTLEIYRRHLYLSYNYQYNVISMLILSQKDKIKIWLYSRCIAFIYAAMQILR